MKPVEFLKRLMEIFNQSSIAYQQYLAGGKTFRFARDLKFHNSNALRLLIENKATLPEELQEDIQSLIIHYSEWSEKWEKLAAEEEHHPDDVFVFANDTTFPRVAAQNIEMALITLNSLNSA